MHQFNFHILTLKNSNLWPGARRHKHVHCLMVHYRRNYWGNPLSPDKFFMGRYVITTWETPQGKLLGKSPVPKQAFYGQVLQGASCGEILGKSQEILYPFLWELASSTQWDWTPETPRNARENSLWHGDTGLFPHIEMLVGESWGKSHVSQPTFSGPLKCRSTLR